MSQITLSILDIATPTPALVSLVIFPVAGSTRSPINFNKITGNTATGASIIEGITARSRLYVWNLNIRILEWQFHRLERIIWLQQNRVGTNPAAIAITCKDEFKRINSYEFNINGRTEISGSAITSNGETSYFSNFNVFANIPETSAVQLNPWFDHNASQDISLNLFEVV